MKTLPGQEVAPSDFAKLLIQIDNLLWELIYKPLVDAVRPALPKPIAKTVAPRMRTETAKELHNAPEDALKKALKDGTVQFVADAKTGDVRFIVAKPARQISDALKAFGARLDKRTGNWTCLPIQVPAWVRAEAASYTARAQAVHQQADDLLKRIEADADKFIDAADLTAASEHAVTEVAAGWKGGAKGLEASWNLSEAGTLRLAAEFKRNRGIDIKSPGSKVGMVDALQDGVKTGVKVWAKEALARLRDQVDANAQQGYRAEGLAERIRQEYGTSKSRSELIARQETGNFMAAYRAARAADAGLKRYEWYCVRDANTRPDHLALHGRIFYYDQPPITDTRTGARNNPGQDFRCLPETARVDFAYGVEKLFRRWYAGELTTVVLDSGESFAATPNHPVFTSVGWLPISALHEGSELLDLRQEGMLGENYVDHRVPMIGQVFEAFRKALPILSGQGHRDQFHGDGSDSDVDVVDAAGFLAIHGQAETEERLRKFGLPEADLFTFGSGNSVAHQSDCRTRHDLPADVAGRRQGPAIIGGKPRHSELVGFGAVANSDMSVQQSTADNHAAQACPQRNGKLTLSTQISGHERGGVNGLPVPAPELGVTIAGNFYTSGTQAFRDVVGTEADALNNIGEKHPLLQHFTRKVKLVRRDRFIGHVFNLQTKHGWYVAGSIIHKNCRCVDRPILE